MPGYVVSVRLSTRAPEELAEYARKSPASAAGRYMKRLATSTGRFRVLAGPQAEGMSILEFPTFEEAAAWFDSAEYQEALAHLLKGADYGMYLIEGETEAFGDGTPGVAR